MEMTLQHQLYIYFTELQKSCGYAGTTREESLPDMRSAVKKVLTLSSWSSHRDSCPVNHMPSTILFKCINIFVFHMVV